MTFNNQLDTLLESFNDMEFYNSETFTTVTDYFLTFDSSFQLIVDGEEVNDNQFHIVETTTHSKDAIPYEIQRDILKSAIDTLSEDEKCHLSVVSSCTHYTEKYEEEISDKIKEGCELFMGKWNFSRDMLNETESELSLFDPLIGCKSHKRIISTRLRGEIS